MSIVHKRVHNANVQDIRDAFCDMYNEWDLTTEIREANDQPLLELTGISFIANEAFILGEPDIDYISRELQWYGSQSLSVGEIPGKTPKIWRDIANEVGEVNSNYGYLIYSEANHEQYLAAFHELRVHPDSRRAVMIYTRPTMHKDATLGGMNDFVCTNVVQYFIRENKLDVVVQMRSNDAVFGYRNDWAWQRVTQQRLRADLLKTYPDLEIGTITWQVGSLHIYPRHIPLLLKARDLNNWFIPTR